MGLIGLGTVTLVGMILAVRSEQLLNKAITVFMWAVAAAYAGGMF